MKRIVSVWLPNFALERLQRQNPGLVPHDAAFVLVDTGPRGLQVAAANNPARIGGIKAGMSLADARAAVPKLASLSRDTSGDLSALVQLVRWAGRYGPARNLDETACGKTSFWVDVTGIAHLYGGEERLIADISERLASLGLTAGAAMADTLAAAAALARHGTTLRIRHVIAPPGRTAEAIAHVPVEGLRLGTETTLCLKRLGLQRIGQLYDLPRTALERRFRKPAKLRHKKVFEADATAVLVYLDRALGRSAEPLRPLTEPPKHLATLVLSDPLLSPEGIDAALARLSEELCHGLVASGEGARRLILTLYRIDGTSAKARIGTSRPCRDSRHILQLFSSSLSRLDAGFGIDVLVLAATSVEAWPSDQSSLARFTADARSDPACLFDRLSNRLGQSCVFRIEKLASHVPERAAMRATRFLEKSATCIRSPGRQDEPAPPATPFQRPPLLLADPEPICVVAEVPDGPPARFDWRRRSHRVLKSEGPERIAPEWWRSIRRRAVETTNGSPRELRPRDYFKIEDDSGVLYWVFREGLYAARGETPPAWYLHGIFG